MTTRASKYEMPTERKMNEILYDLEQNRKAVELDIQVLYEYCKRKYKLLALIKARAVLVIISYHRTDIFLYLSFCCSLNISTYDELPYLLLLHILLKL